MTGDRGAPDVLVVGAGPTGLALALQAFDHGARVRVVERRREAFRPSRALLMHPRTLEVLRPLGIVDALLAAADTAPSVHLHLGRRVVVTRVADLALPDTPYPHLTLLRQMDVERVLAEALAARDVPVERGVELVGLHDVGDEVQVLLRSAAGVNRATCRFLAGCDGAQSTVRAASGIGWRGRAYRREIVLADIELEGAFTPGVAHAAAGRNGLLFVFALGERATWRLLATRPDLGPPPPCGRAGPPVPGRELQGFLDAAGVAARITDVAWSSRVRIQHRLADRYLRGSVFLAGDAAHTNSPAGGQGMNTGIQDAMNLGWKLAWAPSGRSTALLDSYESERRPAAKHVRALTDMLFWAESSNGALPAFLRGRLGPMVAPALPRLLGWPPLLAAGFRVLSGLDTGYGPCGVRPSRGRVGDRLPDAWVSCEGRSVRLHELTARPGVHVLVEPGIRLDGIDSSQRWVQVHRVAPILGSALLGVRPDGYIGFRSPAPDVRRLTTWLASTGAPGHHEGPVTNRRRRGE